MTMKSMTGFGEGEARGKAGRCVVQVQSLNSRYAKLSVGMPRELASLEAKVRGFVAKKTGRGQAGVYVAFTPASGSMQQVVVDRAACRELAAQLEKVRRWLGLGGRIDLRALLATGEILKRETAELARGPVWALMKHALEVACDRLERSREREGRAIAHDLVRRWRRIDSLVWKIDELRPLAVRRYEKRIREKVRTLLEGADYDEGRLLAEVSIYADRTDITEEIVRIRSHLKNFRRLIGSTGEVGKKLDFTSQELLREVNTCATKASDARISRLVIEIKAELEKIREQVQNIQ